jgi:hypothetical protein
MALTADDRAVIENLTTEIKGVKEALNYFGNTYANSFLKSSIELHSAINKLAGLSDSIDKLAGKLSETNK